MQPEEKQVRDRMTYNYDANCAERKTALKPVIPPILEPCNVKKTEPDTKKCHCIPLSSLNPLFNAIQHIPVYDSITSNVFNWCREDYNKSFEACLTLASMGLDQKENLRILFWAQTCLSRSGSDPGLGFGRQSNVLNISKVGLQPVERNIANCFRQSLLSCAVDQLLLLQSILDVDLTPSDLNDNKCALEAASQFVYQFDESFRGKWDVLHKTFFAQLIGMYSPRQQMERSRHTCHVGGTELAQYVPKHLLSIVLQYSDNECFVNMHM